MLATNIDLPMDETKLETLARLLNKIIDGEKETKQMKRSSKIMADIESDEDLKGLVPVIAEILCCANCLIYETLHYGGTTLKNKVVNIVLGAVLVISVIGNIYMVKLFSDTKEDAAALRDQLAAADGQIVDLEGQLTNFAQVQGHVADLQGQLTDFEKVQTEVADLQKQLTESKDLIESLENTITEQKITVANLEEQWANQEQLLLEAQANAKKAAQNGNGGSGGKNNSNNNGSGNGNSGGNRPNTDPNYQGEKEGYVYFPGIGYIPTTGSHTGEDHRNECAPSEDELSGIKIGEM